jgi:hypothetical protein
MLHRAAIFGLLLSAATLLRAGELLDRIVVTVNGHAILQSDWQDEVRYECFVSGRALDGVTPKDRKGALDRLIDQELLREQMNPAESNPTPPEEAEKQFQAIKNDYARDHAAVLWTTALANYHFEEADIKDHIALELSQLRLVDAHLRPSIQIEAGDIATYYKDHFGSQAAGGQKISLPEATPKIRELLIQEKMNELLSAWLDSLHSQAQIKMYVPDSTIEGPVQ